MPGMCCSKSPGAEMLSMPARLRDRFSKSLLRESGLFVEEIAEEDARVRVYRLERDRFDALRTWVEDVEAFWTGQLASFKAHAEKTRGNRMRRR